MQGHHGISRSEAADRLARAGLASLFTDPKPFCWIPASHSRDVVDVWEWEISLHWTEVPCLRQAS